MDIIMTDDLVSYLPNTEIPAASAELYVRLANGVVSRVIGNLDPVPEDVEAITLEVAARGLTVTGPTSVTTAFDGTSKTVRREGLVRAAARRGVYLTRSERDELLRLAGKPRRPRAGSIRLRLPG